MKPFLCYDHTDNQDPDRCTGEEFVVAAASEAQLEALEQANKRLVKLLFKEARLPVALRVLNACCAIAGVSIVFSVIRILLDSEQAVSFIELYQKAAWLFWLGGVLVLLWILLEILSHRKHTRALEGEESQQLSDQMESINRTIAMELGVPANAPELECLSFDFEEKNGTFHPINTEGGYINSNVFAFVEGDQLMLVDEEKKYGLPLSSFKQIHTVEKPIHLVLWGKEASHKEEPYKAYNIKELDDGTVRIQSYHILEFEHNGQAWGLYFPNYELPLVEKLTGLKAQM